MYFLMIAALYVLNIALYIFTPVTPGDSAVTLIHTAGAVGCTHLVFNTRTAVFEPGTGLTTGGSTDTEIGFERLPVPLALIGSADWTHTNHSQSIDRLEDAKSAVT